jgi:carbamoyl-phosphate synthase small subunit
MSGSSRGTGRPEGTAREAILVLEDGTTLRGTGFGADGETFGEMVFNTGMTGYQETLTDPSYCGQIVAMTAPHIGNTGVNDEDPESGQVWVGGYVVREPARIASSWRATASLDEYLTASNVPGIAIRGTRALTMRIRERGAMRAGLSTTEADPAALLERVLASPQMTGADLAKVVTTKAPYVIMPPDGTRTRFRVAAVDLGIKASTPRSMAERGIEVTVLPATSTAAEILATSPDGVFFSNGPGDPAALDYAVAAMRGTLDAGVPVFGICFGSQILSRAVGLSTYKLRYGHRGINQPVMDLASGRVYITSHNHGFAAALPGLGHGAAGAGGTVGAGNTVRSGNTAGPAGGTAVLANNGTGPAKNNWAHVPDAAREPFGTAYGAAVVSHVNLNDGVVEGIRLLDYPAFSVQYHPEAAPGPHDAVDHFDQFCTLMERGHAAA